MFVDVDTDDIRFVMDAETVDRLQQTEHEDGRHTDIDDRRRRAGELDAQQLDAATQEESCFAGHRADDGQRRISPQTDRQRAHDTAGPVDGEGADRVVDLHLLDEVGHQNDEDTAGDADGERANRRHEGATGRDADEAGERAVQRIAQVPLAGASVHKEHRRQTAGRRAQRRVEHDQADQVTVTDRAQGRAGVETVPAEPQDHRAEGSVTHVMRLGRAAENASGARPKHDRTDEGDHAAHRVDNRAAGEVVEAQRAEPAAAPDPVNDNGVDENGDEGAIDQVADKIGALGHRAGGNGAGRGREGELEEEHRQRRDIECAKRLAHHVHAGHEQRSAEQAAVARPERDTETNHPPHNSREASVDEVFEQRIHGCCLPDHAGFQQRKPGLHEEDQEPGEQHPGGIDTHLQRRNVVQRDRRTVLCQAHRCAEGSQYYRTDCQYQ